MASCIVYNNPHGAGDVSSVIFTKEDAASLHYPYYEVLVVRAIVACNWLKHMLVDNGIQSTLYLVPNIIKC